MLFFRKKDSLHKKLSSLGVIFAIPPAFIWLDAMYAMFRKSILVPLYHFIPDSGYFIIMMIFPAISFIMAMTGYLKAPDQDKIFRFTVLNVAFLLVILAILLLSPFF